MSTETQPITRALLKSMSADTLAKLVNDPVKRAEINAFLMTPEGRGAVAEIVTQEVPDEQEEVILPVPTPEEEAAVKAAKDAEIAEATRVLQEEAVKKAAEEEAQALAEAGITIHRDDSGNIIKIIKEYQVTDDNGTPIARPTHLEARSWAEMARKEKEAHIQITRGFTRLKNQKTTFNKPLKPAGIPDVPLLSEEERIKAAMDLNSDDENVVTKADRKLRADQILRDQRQEAINKELRRQDEVSQEFKRQHRHDFNPCEANAQLIADYLKEHSDADGNPLAWTVDNLELAFAATEPDLVPVKGAVVEVPTPRADNPPEASTEEVVEPVRQAAANNPPAPTVQAPPPVAPAVTVPAAPLAANTLPAARPGVNAGIIPGQASGQRPVARPAGLTMKEIWKWTPEQMRKERANPARKAEVDRVIAAYNKERASRV